MIWLRASSRTSSKYSGMGGVYIRETVFIKREGIQGGMQGVLYRALYNQVARMVKSA